VPPRLLQEGIAFRKHSGVCRVDAEPLLGCFGVLLTGAMVILSALINCSFGYSPGATEMTALAFG